MHRADVEHALALVDAIDGAFPDAGFIQDIDAGLRDRPAS
jgi:hypothetical protein